MNEKFYQLPLEKQERIINAAYKVFSVNTYQKAPMSEIASVGGVSKSLLFHYFKNKKELYFFLWDKAIDQLKKAAFDYEVWETRDFFEIIYRGLRAKCSVIRSYPCLYQFVIKTYYEQEGEIKYEVKKTYYDHNKFLEDKVLNSIDVSAIRGDVDIRLLYQEIVLVSDGYLRQMMLTGNMDADQIEEYFTRMIDQWKIVYSS